MTRVRLIRPVATTGLLLMLICLDPAAARGEFLLRVGSEAPASFATEGARRLGPGPVDPAAMRLTPMLPDVVGAETPGRARLLDAPPPGADPVWCVGLQPPRASDTPRDAHASPDRLVLATQMRLPEPPAFVLCGMGLAVLFALSVRRQIHRLNAAF